MPVSTLPQPQLDAASPRLARERRSLPDGALTTVHVGRFARDAFALSVAPIDPCSTLVEWCAAAGAAHAIVGGFYMRPGGPPLGDLWVDGKALPSTPFDPPWDRCRACVHADAGAVALLARGGDRGRPRAATSCRRGRCWSREGVSLGPPGVDAEGFSAGSRQFDSDITAGRYPRAALGLAGPELMAVVCDGRADDDAGMTMAELAEAMVGARREDAINLDGGGSASLVIDGKLVNTPREEHGLELRGGREIATALAYLPAVARPPARPAAAASAFSRFLDGSASVGVVTTRSRRLLMGIYFYPRGGSAHSAGRSPASWRSRVSTSPC